jgi:hypothetical protein
MQSKVKYGLMAIGSAVLGAILFTSYAAKAADKGDKPVSRAQAEAAAPVNAWGGCGVGVFGGWLSAGLDFSPITIGAEAPTAGAHAVCDWQSGRGVIGVTASYGWMFGDLKTVGLNTSLSVGARAGYLVTPSALAYILANWNRIDTDAKQGDVDGYGVGGGIELKMPDAPIFVALQYERGFYADILGIKGLDANTNTVTMRATYKFNFVAR